MMQEGLRYTGYLLGFGAVIVLGFWLFGPKEEIGYFDSSTTCAAYVSTERFAANTFFKTWVCNDYGGTRNCYYQQMQNGVCTKEYNYSYTLEASSKNNSVNSNSLNLSTSQTTQTDTSLSGNAQNDSANPQNSSSKCVTESGVQICDLSYNVTNTAGNSRTVSLKGNELICQDITTDLSTDVRGSTTGITTDPTFCATDYGTVYIDPTINVAKHYGEIITGSNNYFVPSNFGPCIWTYAGGSGDIPYIQQGGYIGPDASFYDIHAFCQNGASELDIFTVP